MGFSLGGGMGGSKSKGWQSQDNSLDPWSQQQFENIAGQVKGQLNQPFKAYTGQLSAGQNAMQAQAAEGVKGLLGYTPQNVQAQSFKGADLSGYMNPYQDQVIDAALGDIERSRQMQRVNDAQGATAAGAWGGSRHGVADALTTESAQRTAANTAASMRADAFNNAANLFQQDANRDFAAQQANANLGLSGAQFGLSAAGLLGQLGAQDRQFAQDALDRQYNEFLRGQDDPFKRSQVLLGLLGQTPMIQDSFGRSKGSSFNWNVNGGVQGSF